MAQNYWVVATPRRGRPEEALRKQLDDATAAKGLSQNYPFRVPNELKVGTIDSLMALSEELSKHDIFVGQTSKRIERSFAEIWKTEPKDDEFDHKADSKAAAETSTAPELLVGEHRVSVYLQNFKWNTLRYPHTRASLKAIVDSIVKDTTKAETDLKKQMTEYNDVRNTIAAIERKEQGSLQVKSLAKHVRAEHIVETDNLTTIFVAVPVAKEDEFIKLYESIDELQRQKEVADAKRRADAEAVTNKRKQEMEKAAGELKRQEAPSTAAPAAPVHIVIHPEGDEPSDEEKHRRTAEEAQKAKELEAKRIAEEKRRDEEEKRKKLFACRNVVPGSAMKLASDSEFVLFRVIVLRKGVDYIRTAFRERRYTPRDFTFDPEALEEDRKQLDSLHKQQKKLWNFLILWCKTTFGEIFSAWTHLKAIRVFVEAVLRYSLPVDFMATLLAPARGQERKLREALGTLYSHLANADLTKPLEGSDVDASQLVGGEFYPYVYFPFKLSD